MARKIQFFIIHNSSTPEGREVTGAEIWSWHTAKPPKGRGWRQVGYSDLIRLDGRIENLSPYNPDEWVDSFEVTNGVKGFNGGARHVVFAGGTHKDYYRKKNPVKTYKDTRTEAQNESLEALVKVVIARYPWIKVAGHNQFSSKDCPGFDVPTWLKSIGVKAVNIYSKK